MQQKKELIEEIKDKTKPSFLPTEVLRAHKGITQVFKFKARNENAINLEEAIKNMRNTLYNIIHNNRNNATQNISIGVVKIFSRPKEVLNDRDLIDPVTGIVHRRGKILIPTNEKIEHDKYYHSKIFKVYPRSSIRKLLQY